MVRRKKCGKAPTEYWKVKGSRQMVFGKRKKYLNGCFGIVCQNCDIQFPDVILYKKHVHNNEHKQKSKSMFRNAPPTEPDKADIPWIVVQEHLKSSKDPHLIGLNMVTMCYSSKNTSEPFYLCHTCHERCSNKVIIQHLTSPEHCLSYFTCRKPNLLRFGWNPRLDCFAALKPSVNVKQETVGPLMMLHMPSAVFDLASKSPYFKVTEEIFRKYLPARLQVEKTKTVMLKEELNKERNAHPILGLSFLVEYRTSSLCGYLCLLCEGKIREDHIVAHLTCIDHVVSALASTHSTSLGRPSDYKEYDPRRSSTILNMAKDAIAKLPPEEVQVVNLNSDAYEEVHSLPFKSALDKLRTVHREQNHCELQLPGNLLIPEPKLAQDQPTQCLWSYIKENQQREPVIGLSAIIECHCEGRPPYYVCRTCSIKMEESTVVAHVTSCGHRYQYMKHHNLLHDWVDEPNLEEQADHLQDLAQQLMHREGFGAAEVLDLDSLDYEVVVLGTIDDALHRLQTVHPDLQIQTNKKEMTQCDLAVHTSDRPSRSDLPDLSPKKEVPVEHSLSSRDLENLEMKAAEARIPTQVYKMLWTFLRSKQRRNPVIGLKAIVEYHEENQAPYLVCEACAMRVPQGFFLGHLFSAEHRYNYIKSLHPKLLNGWKEDLDVSDYQDVLEEKAKELELKEGLGDIQIMKKGKDGFEAVILPFPEELDKSVQMKIKTDRQAPLQNLSLKLEPGRSEGAVKDVKEEHVESHVMPQFPVPDSTSTENGMTVQHSPCPSSKVLLDFLKSPNRNEPVIGLDCVTQVYSEDQLPYYVCDLCEQKMSRGFIIGHIISARHRHTYIMSKHPHLLGDCPASSLSLKTGWKLKNTARSVESREGTGHMKLLKLNTRTFQQLVSVPSSEALILLQNICNPKKQMDLKCDAAPEPTSSAIKASPPIAPVLSSSTTASTEQDSPAHSTPSPPSEGFDQEKTTESSKSLLTPVSTKIVEEGTHRKSPPLLDVEQTSPSSSGSKALHSHVTCEAMQSSVKVEPESPPVVKETEKLPVAEQVLQLPEEVLKMVTGMKREACASEGSVLLSRIKTEPRSVVSKEVFSRLVALPAPALDNRLFQIKKDDIPIDESHLGKFLSVSGRDSKEPVIGLGDIVECRCFKRPTFYLCLSCLEKVDMANICKHIIHRHHRLCYIKSRHPYLLKGWKDSLHMETNAKHLMRLAVNLMKKEGSGHAQVIKLQTHSYQEVASASFDVALDKLQIHRGQNAGKFGHFMDLVTYSRKSDQGWSIVQQPHHGPGNTLPKMAENEQTPSTSPKVQPVTSQTPEKCVKPAAPALPSQRVAPQKVARIQEAGPGEQSGSSTRRRALQEYLSKCGEDPIVLGLEMVVECRCVEDESRPYYYLCKACMLKVTEEFIVEHLSTCLHQYHYITSHQPWALEEVKKKKTLLGISDQLKLASQKLWRKLGPEKVQVIMLQESSYSKLAVGNYTSCMLVINGSDSAEKQEKCSKTIKRSFMKPPNGFVPGLRDSRKSIVARVLPIKSNAVSTKASEVEIPSNNPPKEIITKSLKTDATLASHSLYPAVDPFPACSGLIDGHLPRFAGSVLSQALALSASSSGVGDASPMNVVTSNCISITPASSSPALCLHSSSMAKSQHVACDQSSASTVISNAAGFDQSSTKAMDNVMVPLEASAAGHKPDISSHSPAGKQRINDLIIELIVRKELMDAHLKKLGAQNVLGMCSNMQRGIGEPGATFVPKPAENNGTSLHKELPPGSSKQEPPEDDGDAFNYESRQFTAAQHSPNSQEDPQFQQWNSVKRKNEHPERERQVKLQRTDKISSTLTSESVGSVPHGGFIYPITPTLQNPREYWSSVNSGAVSKATKQALVPQMSCFQSKTASNLAGQMTRGLPGMVDRSENVYNITEPLANEGPGMTEERAFMQ